MYRSLHSVFKSIISSKSTGVLNITHYSNDRGIIYFSSGAIVRVKTNEFQGTQAAETIFSWISFFTQFTEKKLKITANANSVTQTEKIMAYLARIDKKIKAIIDNVEGCETVLSLTQSANDVKSDFTPEEQSLSFAIDGVKTIIEILVKSELSELAMLTILSGFVDRDIAEVKRLHSPIPIDANENFFSILLDVLSEITGPVAEVLLDEVLDAMGMEREDLSNSDIGPMLDSIQKRLDSDEQEEFNARDIVAQAFPE
jgi:hypothetical protein